MRKLVYLLQLILKHYFAFWDPSLQNQTVKDSSLLLPETTPPHLGGSLAKAAAKEIFFRCVNK